MAHKTNFPIIIYITNFKIAKDSFFKIDPLIKEYNNLFKDLNYNIPTIEAEINNLQKLTEEQKKKLENFNNLFSTNLTGNEEKIIIIDKNIGDEGFEKLSEIPFNNLRVLVLKWNKIINLIL